MYSRGEEKERLERDITGFKLLRQAFQEIMDKTSKKTSKRIEEIKCLGKEIYGIDVYDPLTAGEQFHLLSEKGEEEFLNWARLLPEGMLLEAGREHLEKRKAELELMLGILENILARNEEARNEED